ncbi:hypothetical protein, partial [Vibrio parahaemolyticus]|uniref:hypothetical protein n=1 Tax=Vibrio parahaemolyticus TaxID=670 RepID=UPI001D16671A
ALCDQRRNNMEYIPKLLASKFKWAATSSILKLWFICVCFVFLMPLLVPILMRINGDLVLLMLSAYLVFLLGIFSAKYYSRTDVLLGTPVPKNNKPNFVFLAVFYFKLSCAVLLAVSPLLFGD